MASAPHRRSARARGTGDEENTVTKSLAILSTIRAASRGVFQNVRRLCRCRFLIIARTTGRTKAGTGSSTIVAPLLCDELRGARTVTDEAMMTQRIPAASKAAA
jgi:hypothetical protein